MAMEPVFTLADLRTASFAPVPLAVLGHPIAHSLSPRMHNAALTALARDSSAASQPPEALAKGGGRAGSDRVRARTTAEAQARPEVALHPFSDWHYDKFDIEPAALSEALAALAARGFLGVNLTVPHKVLAVAEVADIEPSARAAGAVNTLLRTGAGWHGFNTDGYGLAMGVRETLGCELGGQAVILLGAGGAARGAAVECLARGCASLAVGNRTAATRDALLAELRPLAGTIPLRGFDPSAPPADLPDGALVINATSLGLQPDEPPPIDLALLPPPSGVYDMIYNPPQTALLAAAARLGLPAANGLSMLVHQGARALEIWSGVPATVTAPSMAAALR